MNDVPGHNDNLDKLKELAFCPAPEEVIDVTYLTVNYKDKGDVTRPVLRYPNNVFLGVSPEAVDLGENYPEFILRFPKQADEEIPGIVASSRVSMGKNIPTPGDIPILDMRKLTRTQQMKEADHELKFGPHSKRLVDVDPVMEDGITLLMLQPKKVRDGIQDIPELRTFLRAHKERIDGLFPTDEQGNKEMDSQDYLRIPSLANVEFIITQHCREVFKKTHKDLLYGEHGKEDFEAAFKKEYERQKADIHQKAVAMINSGTIWTVEPTDYEHAKEARVRMDKSVQWIQKVVGMAQEQRRSITKEEIDQYLFNCFITGQYPNLDEEPDLNDVRRGASRQEYFE